MCTGQFEGIESVESVESVKACNQRTVCNRLSCVNCNRLYPFQWSQSNLSETKKSKQTAKLYSNHFHLSTEITLSIEHGEWCDIIVKSAFSPMTLSYFLLWKNYGRKMVVPFKQLSDVGVASIRCHSIGAFLCKKKAGKLFNARF